MQPSLTSAFRLIKCRGVNIFQWRKSLPLSQVFSSGPALMDPTKERPSHVQQLSVIRVHQSVNVKEKWATETQSTIIPEDICHFSEPLL